MTSFAFLDIDPRYMIDSDGNVYGPRGRVLKGGMRRDGYPMIRGTNWGRAVHRLVAESFVPNPGNKPCVAHGDGNKMNPAAFNLRWATHEENMADQLLHGTRARGEKQGGAKLSYQDVAFIKDQKGKYRGVQQDLSVVFGVSNRTINKIHKGINWRDHT